MTKYVYNYNTYQNAPSSVQILQVMQNPLFADLKPISIKIICILTAKFAAADIPTTTAGLVKLTQALNFPILCKFLGQKETLKIGYNKIVINPHSIQSLAQLNLTQDTTSDIQIDYDSSFDAAFLTDPTSLLYSQVQIVVEI